MEMEVPGHNGLCTMVRLRRGFRDLVHDDRRNELKQKDGALLDITHPVGFTPRGGGRGLRKSPREHLEALPGLVVSLSLSF